MTSQSVKLSAIYFIHPTVEAVFHVTEARAAMEIWSECDALFWNAKVISYSFIALYGTNGLSYPHSCRI